jgi:ABC-2 type transport system permease protein
MEFFYWPVMELLVWGFLTVYLTRIGQNQLNIVTFLLGGLIFWDLLSQSQRAVSIGFLEDVWYRNFINLFVSPLKISEFVISTMLLGFIRIIIVGSILGILAFLFYSFNIFSFGFYLLPFLLNLLLFGWVLGLFTTGLILRFGQSAQVLAFGFIFLVQPFSAVFYPLSVLPKFLQPISLAIPSTYLFEGMRSVIIGGEGLILPKLLTAFFLNLFYLFLVYIFFLKMFARVKRKAMLMKLD